MTQQTANRFCCCFCQVATATPDNAKSRALWQLEAAALAAVKSVGAEPAAAPVWLAALEVLAAAGAPLEQLLDQLSTACLGQCRGPVRVHFGHNQLLLGPNLLMFRILSCLAGMPLAAFSSSSRLVSGSLQGGMGTAAAAAVEAAHVVSGVPAARALWRRLAAGPSPGGELFLAAARAEATAIAAGEAGAAAAAARAAFEAGVAAHGAQDWQLWVEYVQFAQQQPRGGVPSSGALIQRARKALHDPDAFATALKDALV